MFSLMRMTEAGTISSNAWAMGVVRNVPSSWRTVIWPARVSEWPSLARTRQLRATFSFSSQFPKSSLFAERKEGVGMGLFFQHGSPWG